MLATKIIPITDFRRNFGENTDDILMVETYILTKGGRPFATLRAAPELRRESMKKFAGSLKGTDLYDDKIWNEVFKRKSRKSILKI